MLSDELQPQPATSGLFGGSDAKLLGLSYDMLGRGYGRVGATTGQDASRRPEATVRWTRVSRSGLLAGGLRPSADHRRAFGLSRDASQPLRALGYRPKAVPIAQAGSVELYFAAFAIRVPKVSLPRDTLGVQHPPAFVSRTVHHPRAKVTDAFWRRADTLARAVLHNVTASPPFLDVIGQAARTLWEGWVTLDYVSQVPNARINQMLVGDLKTIRLVATSRWAKAAGAPGLAEEQAAFVARADAREKAYRKAHAAECEESRNGLAPNGRTPQKWA